MAIFKKHGNQSPQKNQIAAQHVGAPPTASAQRNQNYGADNMNIATTTSGAGYDARSNATNARTPAQIDDTDWDALNSQYEHDTRDLLVQGLLDQMEHGALGADDVALQLEQIGPDLMAKHSYFVVTIAFSL